MITDLVTADNILIMGAGGGYDIYAGIPLMQQLRAAGRTVHLANYSLLPNIAAVHSKEEVSLTARLVCGFKGEITQHTQRDGKPYFPEGKLGEYLNEHIWTFPKCGVDVVSKSLLELRARLGFEQVLLIDGGVDSLMRGDEVGTGTYLEDSVTLAAVHSAGLIKTVLACIGLGTEGVDGLSHSCMLENWSSLVGTKSYLGCQWLDDVSLLEKAYQHAIAGGFSPSHITPYIIEAAKGNFGGNPCVNPLMATYFFFKAADIWKKNKLNNGMFLASKSFSDVTLISRGVEKTRNTVPFVLQ